MRAAAYIRVSTLEQATHGISLDVQREKIERYVAARQWELINIFEDAGISAASDDRKGLQSLLVAASQNQFETVVVTDLSRFGRNLLQLKQNLEMLKSHSVRFVAFESGVDGASNGALGELIVNILGSIYQFERELILARTTASRLKLLRNLDAFIGSAPYCYRWDKVAKKLIQVEHEVEIYKRITDSILIHGKSLAKIAKELTDEGVANRQNTGFWRQSGLSKMVHNPTYYTGIVSVTQANEIFEFPCEPVITRQKWNEIQEILATAKSRSGRPGNNADYFLLHKKLRCHNGHRLQSHYGTKRTDGTRSRSYTCMWHDKPDHFPPQNPTCTFVRIAADEIEEFVWNELLKIIKGERYEAFRNADLPERTRILTVKLADFAKELAKRNVIRDGLDEALAAGLPGVVYAAKYNSISEEILTLQDQLITTKQELDNLQEIKIEEQQFLKYREYFRMVFATHAYQIRTAPFEKKQKLLQGMLIGEIVIPEDHNLQNLRIPWRYNLELLRELFPFLPDPEGGSGPVTPDRYFEPPAGTPLNSLSDGNHRGGFRHEIHR